MALNEERDTEATETTAQESVPDAQKADEAKAESSTEPEVQPNPLREADIAKKEALVSELQEFVRTSDWRHGSQQLRPTMDSWRAIHNWHTAKEDELWEAFQTARHTIYAERTHEREASQAAKEKLDFSSDYLEGCADEIMDRLVATNHEKSAGYGLDEHSLHA